MEIFKDSGCVLTPEKALDFLVSPSPMELGRRADALRAERFGRNAHYAVNAAISYSNICEALCPICSFSRRKGQEGAYLLSTEEIYERAKKFVSEGAEEIHIIGGIYSELDFEYYLDVAGAVKAADKSLNLVAFTVSECALMARVSGISLAEVIEKLKEAGVDALPGGGAEIFAERVRKVIAPNKLTASEWLDAMRVAHGCGLRTNATMLYGSIERPDEIVDHLFMLRGLQSQTGGFKAFVPLPYRQGKSNIVALNSGVYDLKVCALARIVLDNFAHIRVPIPHFGSRLAQILLNFGADDVGGTHWHEEVAASAGAAPERRSEQFMRDCIVQAGFNPVKCDSNYNPRK